VANKGSAITFRYLGFLRIFPPRSIRNKVVSAYRPQYDEKTGVYTIRLYIGKKPHRYEFGFMKDELKLWWSREHKEWCLAYNVNNPADAFRPNMSYPDNIIHPVPQDTDNGGM